MKRICCPNCGRQVSPEPENLGELPLEEVVASDDAIRILQLAQLRSGSEAPHSINLADGG